MIRITYGKWPNFQSLFPLSEAIRLEEPTQEITTEFEPTPYVQIVRKTTTEKSDETTTITPTTTFETTTKMAATLKHTTEGTTHLPPGGNEETTKKSQEFEDTTNIPTTSGQQTTYYPKTTLGDNFDENFIESTYLPDSTLKPRVKSTINDIRDTTTKQFEENFETKVKLVTVRGVAVNVDNTRGHPKTTTPPKVPPRGNNFEEDTDNKGALKTLTKLVLYKIISSSAPTNAPYLCYLVTLLVIFRDLYFRY